MYNDYKKKLDEIIKIKSVSTDKAYKGDISKMALWCEKELKSIGFTTKVYKGYGNPIVYGELRIEKNFPTILGYGHYDVQPAKKEDGWKGDPFTLRDDGKRLYGRGTTDNKGQFLIYLVAIKKLLQENKLRNNLIFIIEGDEEVGSGLLPKFMKDLKPKADFALISDGSMHGDVPAISASFRTTINAQLTIYGPKVDIHSGRYGGMVNNPINVLSNVISEISSGDGKTEIFAKYESKPKKDDLKKLKSAGYDMKMFYKATGLKNSTIKDVAKLNKRLGFESVMLVTGFKAGYIDEGFKNAIPASATAKLNFRVNPGIEGEKAAKIIEKSISSILKGTDYKLEFVDVASGVLIGTSDKKFKDLEKKIKKVYKKSAVYEYEGALVPIGHDIQYTLKSTPVFFGLANEDSNVHSINENFEISYIKKGLNFVYEILSSDNR